MSEKMECPGCEAYTSSVLIAFHKGEACPWCGLSASAAAEILEARHNVNIDLLDEYTKAIIRADKALTRVWYLEGVLANIHQELKKVKAPRPEDIAP